MNARKILGVAAALVVGLAVSMGAKTADAHGVCLHHPPQVYVATNGLYLSYGYNPYPVYRPIYAPPVFSLQIGTPFGHHNNHGHHGHHGGH